MSKTVLICDDAMFMRSVIADVLAPAGFEVVGEASTGEEAVERYAETNPDLVTMDIVMPDMSGIEAVKHIMKADSAARILMCTALGQEALANEAIAAGAKYYVVKPFQPDQLLKAVEQTMA